MQDYKKIDYAKNKDVVLRYIPGHFVTPNSHVNYYMDLTDMKSRQREARATGEELAEMYFSSDLSISCESTWMTRSLFLLLSKSDRSDT